MEKKRARRSRQFLNVELGTGWAVPLGTKDQGECNQHKIPLSTRGGRERSLWMSIGSFPQCVHDLKQQAVHCGTVKCKDGNVSSSMRIPMGLEECHQ